MKNSNPTLIVAATFFILSIFPPILYAALTYEERVASAYIRAVTGAGKEATKKVADDKNSVIDFTACIPAKEFAAECQKIVLNGKDGKTIFMEVLNEANLKQLLPARNAKNALSSVLFQHLANCNNFYDPSACKKQASQDNGWYTYNPTVQDNKTRLREYLIKVAHDNNPAFSPALFTFFEQIPAAKVTEISIPVRIDMDPDYFKKLVNPTSPPHPLYFWALVVQFSPTSKDIDSVTSQKPVQNWWGHLGLQIAATCKNSQTQTPHLCANWGGGGQGDGTGDYGAGGSIVKAFAWKRGVTYILRIKRGGALTSNSDLYNWMGIIEWTERQQEDIKTRRWVLGEIIGGPYIVTEGFRQSWSENYKGNSAVQALAYTGNHPHVMIETGYGVTCASPRVSAYWQAPSYKENNKPPQRVRSGRMHFNSACENTTQKYQGLSFEHHLNARRLPMERMNFNVR